MGNLIPIESYYDSEQILKYEVMMYNKCLDLTNEQIKDLQNQIPQLPNPENLPIAEACYHF
jgi:hypothetical protein|tara:strand:+ start:132 stop:314 length:183 start_codon:yes stop_codon:yes gene_type:complete